MKNFLCGLALLLGLSACSTEVKPPPTPAPPPPRPVEKTGSYWLSHPSIALVAAEHDMGPDTVMAIVNAFNELYPNNGTPGTYEDNDHTVAIRPIYVGQGPDPNLLRWFFINQARQYKTTRQEISKVISEVYRNGNKLTQRD